MANEPNFWVVAVPAASGLMGAVGGAFLGAWLSRSNEQRRQRLEFAKQQLSEFYSPMLSLRTHIHSLSTLRVRIEEMAHEVLFPEDHPDDSPDVRKDKQNLRHDAAQALSDLIRFDNEQFRTVLLPLYEEMLKTFREKFWLADSDVQQHYDRLVEYVELWKRHLDKTVPSGVIAAMRVEERKLHPLYEALETQFRRRQRMLERHDPDIS